MCVLCTGFISQLHWTDKRIREEEAVTEGDQLRRSRRERLHRASLANKVLCYFGLKLEDWNGSKFILSDKKGRQEVIQDLGELWPAAEKLTGRKLDPLAPPLIERIKAEVASKNHNE